jgi:hypothetical protein
MIRVSGFHSLRRSARFRAFDTRKHCTRTKYVHTRPDLVTPDGNERTSPDPSHQNECTVLLQETCGLKGFNPLILSGISIIEMAAAPPLLRCALLRPHLHSQTGLNLFLSWNLPNPPKHRPRFRATLNWCLLMLQLKNKPVVSKKRGALGMD